MRGFVGPAGLAGLLLLGCSRAHVQPDGGSEGGRIADPMDAADGGEIPDATDAVVEFTGLPPPSVPFSIPAAPAAGTLRPCGATAPPVPLGFLPDGRPVIAQTADVGITLVRIWDPRTHALDDILIATSGAQSGAPGVRMSADGRRIFDIDGAWFRAFDVGQRRYLSDAPVPIAIRAISGDGNFVLDLGLLRYGVAGDVPFDFQPLVPAGIDTRFIAAGGLSFTGDAVALALRSTSGTFETVVVFQDGRTLTLPDAPDHSSCLDSCEIAWSGDGRFVLERTREFLQVWDLQAQRLVLREDARMHRTVFLPNSKGLITVGPNSATVERNFSGSPTFSWGTAGWPVVPDTTGNRILFLGAHTDGETQALFLANRNGPEGRWGQASTGGYFSFALTGEALFATFDHPPFVGPQALGRSPIAGGPLTHVFHTGESQSEFNGQVVRAPDEQRVAAVFPDTVRVLDAATLALVATIPSGAGMVAWSPDGRYLATTPDVHYRDPGRSPNFLTREVPLWDSLSGRVAARFPVPLVPVSVAFDDQGKKLVGWGYPDFTFVGDSNDLIQYRPVGDPTSFEVDVVSGRASAGLVPPFAGATRELVATDTSIVRASTGEVVSVLPAPPIESAVFSGNWSVLLGIEPRDERLGNYPLHPFRLFGVRDGHVIASGTMLDRHMGPQFALSRDARRVAVSGAGVLVYCLDEPRP